MISKTNVVPRSSPIITSKAMMTTPGSSGMSSCRQSSSWPSFSLRASRSAPHSRNANLASSDGWNWTPPNCIQRAAPPLYAGGGMTRTTTRPRSDTNISGYAAARNRRGEHLAATHMQGSPISTPNSWCCRPDQGEMPCIRPAADEVDKHHDQAERQAAAW